MNFKNNIEDDVCLGYWNADTLRYREEYEEGLLKNGLYYDREGTLLSEIKAGHGQQSLFEDGALRKTVEFNNGKPEGMVKTFLPSGALHSTFHVKDGKKEGEECVYYPEMGKPKLSLNWRDDILQGIAKTWYDNGTMESQREMNRNKKQGLCFGWFKDGSLMLMEEYENDLLLKGSYFKKNDPNPVSKIDSGKGIATLYDSNGFLKQKVTYEKGKPLLNE